MKQIEHEAAKLLAETCVLKELQGFAYPIVPTDDDGNPQRYDPGCVPWVVCTGVQVDRTYFENEALTEDGDLEVLVDVTLSWVGGEPVEEEEKEEENEATFMLTIGWDDDELVVKDRERVD